MDEYWKAYNDGYHRAMLDYGLEDDLCKWEQIRAEIASHIGGNGMLNDGLDMALGIIDKHLDVSEVWNR